MKRLLKHTLSSGLDLLLLPCRGITSKKVASIFHRTSLHMVLRSGTPYAPNGERHTAGFQRPMEAFTTRWEKVSKAITQHGARNLLDVGCAEGYMIQKAAKEAGVFAVGLERDWSRIAVGYAQAQLGTEYNCGIVPFAANSESLSHLPKFDVVVCFSVLHHVIRHCGLDEARAFLTSLADKTGKCFLFDMCSPEETANDPQWGVVLDFLKGDVVGKTAELLSDAGFRNVQHIASTPGYVPPGMRPLFLCDPPAR